MTEKPTRNLALDLVRTTEAAALAAGRWMGRGKKEEGDQAAVDAMRLVLNSIDINGVIIIGEGEKDEAPMLFNGEHLGSGDGPEMDIAVDPVEGTRLLAQGRPNSVATIALAERGSMFDPGPIVYMSKIAVGEYGRGKIDLDVPIEENIRMLARAKGGDVDDLTVIILERDRHSDLIQRVRETGARIRLITDGDVAGAIMTARPETGIDMLVGVGGTPEGVLAACAMKCMGGEIQGRLYPRNEEEAKHALDQGYELERVLTMEDLVSGDDIFFSITGITDGELVEGVKYYPSGARTHSLVMRSKTRTVREIIANHNWEALMEVSEIQYDRIG
ncbi:MAG: class II fructose-bisphosphatase [Anaerolineales bacterium]|nr:class II fructose-bisphosphatase [Anaerolineales bacterium]